MVPFSLQPIPKATRPSAAQRRSSQYSAPIVGQTRARMLRSFRRLRLLRLLRGATVQTKRQV